MKCGKCACAASTGLRLRFWFEAPQWLIDARELERLRRRDQTVAADAPIDVMIVDDDEEIRSMAAYCVQRMGYSVALAACGEGALKSFERSIPRLIITDALMPKMDGRELCQSVKSSYPSIKVIIMTSLYTASRYRYEAYRRYRADDYLAKPIDFAQLQEALQRILPGAVR
jgi:CheY-like chemotaxis protein